MQAHDFFHFHLGYKLHYKLQTFVIAQNSEGDEDRNEDRFKVRGLRCLNHSFLLPQSNKVHARCTTTFASAICVRDSALRFEPLGNTTKVLETSSHAYHLLAQRAD